MNDRLQPRPASAAADLFRTTFGTEPDGSWSAPGRVNLIGEHTDYNLGLVLPFAICDRTHLAVRRTTGSTLRFVSTLEPEAVASFEVDGLRPRAERPGTDSWADYAAGVWWVLAGDHRDGTGAGDGPSGGLEVAVASTVPLGAGLSSSAALECATAVALVDLFDLSLDQLAVARVGQRAENDFVGMPCGLMDQLASTEGRAGHALAVDFTTHERRQVRFDPAASDLSLVVIDTQVHHALADGEYGKRRASCEQAARTLGVPNLSVPQLRGLTPDALDRVLAPLDEPERRRARHVITENDRVSRAVACLDVGELAGLGALFDASHASMALDFEITCAETDAAQRAALEAGAIGARQTGGGFGGSVITLVDRDYLDRVTVAVTRAAAALGAPAPVVRVMEPGPGAGRDD